MMKTAKLVTGILSLVFPAMILFQSCAAGMSNALEGGDEVSGTAGLLLSLLMIAGGIVMIATRNSEKKGGSVASVLIFGAAALIGYTLAGSFVDLKIWATWCIIMAAMNVVAMVKGIRREEREQNVYLTK